MIKYKFCCKMPSGCRSPYITIKSDDALIATSESINQIRLWAHEPISVSGRKVLIEGNGNWCFVLHDESLQCDFCSISLSPLDALTEKVLNLNLKEQHKIYTILFNSGHRIN